MIIKNLVQDIVLIVVLVLSIKTNAQTDSLTVHELNGKSYYIHVIEQGNTLYFLSKMYNTPVDVIKKENPSTHDGLSLGEKILSKNNSKIVKITKLLSLFGLQLTVCFLEMKIGT